MTAPIGRKAGRYATAVGARHTAPSVTAVISILDKPALAWGASKEAAQFATYNRPELERLSLEDQVDRIRTHFRGVWDRKANIGSLTHAVNEAWVQGAAFGPCDVDEFLPKVWRGDAAARAQLWDEASPYVDGLAAFWADCDPLWVHTERCVFDPTPGLDYGGQFDILADIAGVRWRLDIKTGKLERETGRPYSDTALQLVAYDRAPFMGVYDPATGEMTATEPNEAAERCGVLHLPGDGSWDIYPVVAGDAEFEYFQLARWLWGWLRHSKGVVEAAAPIPHPSRNAIGLALLASMEGAVA